MSRIAYLFFDGGRDMTCPPEPLLLLHDAGDLPEDIAEGWTAAALHEHVAGCRRCRRAIEGWQRSLDSFRDLDVVETSAYDDAFFDDLAREVDVALGRDADRPRVVPLRRRPLIPPMAWAAAALLLFALGVAALRPYETPALADAAPDEAAPATDLLLKEGRELGRAWLTEALGDETADQLAWSDPTDETGDEDYPFATSLYDEFDELSGDELTALFTRL